MRDSINKLEVTVFDMRILHDDIINKLMIPESGGTVCRSNIVVT